MHALCSAALQCERRGVRLQRARAVVVCALPRVYRACSSARAELRSHAALKALPSFTRATYLLSRQQHPAATVLRAAPLLSWL